MSVKINRTFQRVASDGRVGKKDVQQMLEQALDGKGVTKTEAKALLKIRDEKAGTFTKAGLEAFDRFLGKMNRSWSSTKNVHLPNMDDDALKELMTADPRFAVYANRSSSGKGGSSAPAPAPAPVSSGGKSRTSTVNPLMRSAQARVRDGQLGRTDVKAIIKRCMKDSVMGQLAAHGAPSLRGIEPEYARAVNDILHNFKSELSPAATQILEEFASEIRRGFTVTSPNHQISFTSADLNTLMASYPNENSGRFVDPSGK